MTKTNIIDLIYFDRSLSDWSFHTITTITDLLRIRSEEVKQIR